MSRMVVIGVVNGVLKVTMAVNLIKLGGVTNLSTLITNLKSVDRCGELEGRHRRHQVRLEGDDGGESDKTGRSY